MKTGQDTGTGQIEAGQNFSETGQKTGTKDRDTLARARPSFGGDVPVVPRDTAGGTQTVVSGQVQVCALRAPTRPGPAVAVEAGEGNNSQIARLNADPRFASWAAGWAGPGKGGAK